MRGERRFTLAKKSKRYSVAFKQMALALMQRTDSVRALARQLGVSPGTLYRWRRQASQRTNSTLEPTAEEPDWTLADVEARIVLLEREMAFRSLENGNFKSTRLREMGRHKERRIPKRPRKRKREK